MQPNQGEVDAWGNPVDAYGQPVAPAQPQVDAFGQPLAQQAPAQPQVDAYGQPVAAAPAAPAPVIINIQQNWAPAPQGVPSSVPQGLEYLYFVDSLYVKQQMELFEAFTAFETSNRYKVLNSNGQQVYFAGEQSGCVAKCCCGPNRDF
ncbi:Oidioi.mRNA.OKI2018_I69.chr1.g1182.t1.cds [Oikopleura dioica]|uniref:Phospholipid scramblase n=1 Tax=Oikopleura dioica TaxID=34765 RepID=A0ABN7SNU8_OIKDI|nr:Oidioi.mRNA.OKI2018_I69.chr1.g1182.t1.cds [Oikopleura dioica]